MPPPPRTRLIVLFGGQSAEHDVSCVSARHVLAAVDPDRYRVEAVGITRDGRWVRADDAIAALAAGPDALPDALTPDGPRYDLVADTAGADQDETVVALPLLHGPLGEDGTVQGLLELAGVPYVGAGVLGSALAMDKLKAKEVLSLHGIPQARYVGLHADEIDDDTVEELFDVLGLPLFVKPANMGSSIGVTRATDRISLARALDHAATYDEWLVAEEAIVGREIEVSVLGNRELKVSVPGEIRPAKEFYDFDDKYLDGNAELIIPAELPDADLADLRRIAVDAYRALRIEGMGRVDFLYEPDGRGMLLNEINTIPGFTPISMYPKMWAASGLSYPELIDALVDLALERHARRRRRTDH